MSDDNGLYYMRARYYNISIKRFINQDVLTGTIKDSQSLNRYAYVEGNPVTYLDPFGMERFDTSGLHEGAFWGGLGITGLMVLSGATGGPIIVVGTIASIILAGVDVIASDYDQNHAATYNESVNANAGAISSLISFTIVLKNADPVIGVTWSVVSYVSGKINVLLDRQ